MSTELRAFFAIVSAVSLAGCGENFKPPSYVDGLRILAVRAEVPELAPSAGTDGSLPSRTELEVLIADPAQLDDPDREVTALFFACTPDPLDPTGSGCSALANLRIDAKVARAAAAAMCAGGSGGGAASPMRFAGVASCVHGQPCSAVSLEVEGVPLQLPAPAYEIPDDTDLEILPSDHPARVRGIQAMISTVAVAASPAELLNGADASDPCAFATALGARLGDLLETRESVTAVKRVQIRGPDARDEPNVNPIVTGISARGEALPEDPGDPVGPEALIAAGAAAALLPLLPDDGVDRIQRYTRLDATGAPVEVVDESWTWSWYASAGTIERLRTRATTEPAAFTAPTGKKDDPLPASKRIFVWTVVRDGRGGVDWVTRELRL
ncbi:MAG TPA: hypothetical protein VGD74_01890, partial [Vulgatibacter sp.]